MVPPLAFGDLKAVLIGLQALKLADEADLDLLRDDTAERLSITAFPTPRWNEHRDDFLQSLPGILKQLPAEAPVAPETYQKKLKELEDYKTEYTKGQQEIQRLQAVNAGLMKIKDPARAAAVVRKHSSSVENFETLVSTVKLSLHPLPNTVREALYQRARGDDYYPEEWDDVRSAIEDGQLIENAEETGVRPRDSDPKVGKAIEALDDLANWLENPPSDFDDWYSASFEDSRADLRLRPFWAQHFN